MSQAQRLETLRAGIADGAALNADDRIEFLLSGGVLLAVFFAAREYKADISHLH